MSRYGPGAALRPGRGRGAVLRAGRCCVIGRGAMLQAGICCVTGREGQRCRVTSREMLRYTQGGAGDAVLRTGGCYVMGWVVGYH